MRVERRSNDRMLKQNAWMRQKCLCLYCGEQLEFKDVTLDHFVPASRGGLSVPENAVAACLKCNWAKGDSHPDEFAARTRLFERLPHMREIWPKHGHTATAALPNPNSKGGAL